MLGTFTKTYYQQASLKTENAIYLRSENYL